MVCAVCAVRDCLVHAEKIEQLLEARRPGWGAEPSRWGNAACTEVHAPDHSHLYAQSQTVLLPGGSMCPRQLDPQLFALT